MRVLDAADLVNMSWKRCVLKVGKDMGQLMKEVLFRPLLLAVLGELDL